jgi:hypothetical protein
MSSNTNPADPVISTLNTVLKVGIGVVALADQAINKTPPEQVEARVQRCHKTINAMLPKKV